MVVAGIDVGAKTTKVAVLKDGRVAAKAKVLTGFDQREAANRAYDEALRQAGLSRAQVAKVVATGVGKDALDFATEKITEISAAARGGFFVAPLARTVIDVGAEEARAVKIDSRGGVADFAINDKCAAGAGIFLETMARALEMSLEEMARISLESTEEIPMNAQCVVFAESEVVSLIHARTPKADIARAVHDAMASRVASITRRVGVEKEVLLIGGLGRNMGFVESLKRDLGVEIHVPGDPEFIGAIGAAVFAASEEVG